MVFYSIFFSEGIWRISSLIVLLAAFITFNELQNSFYDGTFFSNSSDGTNCSRKRNNNIHELHIEIEI